MPERFLRYSLLHARPVRVLLADTMKYRNITVTALSEESFTGIFSGRRTPDTLPLSAVLAAGYARGDRGDTLENKLREERIAARSEQNEE